jgi:hypothetical protein
VTPWNLLGVLDLLEGRIERWIAVGVQPSVVRNASGGQGCVEMGGLTALRQRFVRRIGVPTTRAGVERKVGRVVLARLLRLLRRSWAGRSCFRRGPWSTANCRDRRRAVIVPNDSTTDPKRCLDHKHTLLSHLRRHAWATR